MPHRASLLRMGTLEDEYERVARERGLDPLLVRALAEGVPWPLALEAVASTRLDRDDRDGTHTV
jgi:hypothetical protein